MTPEQLKASILLYAVQGKLVEQREAEGTANNLFNLLQKKKEQLIESKEILKKQPTQPFYDEEYPFDIPETWKWVQLSDVSIIQEGAGIRKFQYRDSGTQILCVTNILEGEIDIEKKKLYIDTEEYKEKYIHLTLNKGDIVTSCSGGSWGKIAFYDKDEVMMLNTSTLRMRFFDDIADNNYLYYVCQSSFFKRQLTEQLSGMQPNFGYAHYSRICFPLPPLEEQHRIVAKIEQLLPFVDRYAASYEKLEQFNAKFPEDMKKSILQYAIQGKLVEQRLEEGTAEELYQQIQKEKEKLIKEKKLKKTRALPQITENEIPYEFPQNWRICYIDDIAFVTKLAGFEYSKYIANNLVPEGIPLFKGKNVQNGRLVMDFESYIPENVSNELPRSQITKKCLLTPYVGTIGNIAIFEGEFKAHLGSNVGKIELLNSEDETFVLEEYLLWYLRSTYGYSELTKYKKATAQESISIDAIRNVIIALPPLEEQKRIVAKIEELLPYCDRLIK